MLAYLIDIGVIACSVSQLLWHAGDRHDIQCRTMVLTVQLCGL